LEHSNNPQIMPEYTPFFSSMVDINNSDTPPMLIREAAKEELPKNGLLFVMPVESPWLKLEDTLRPSFGFNVLVRDSDNDTSVSVAKLNAVITTASGTTYHWLGAGSSGNPYLGIVTHFSFLPT
jgi:hypothetical protein